MTDSSGAVVPKATVLLTDVDRNQSQTTATNVSGLYTFSNLTAGHYRVTAEQTGFKKALSEIVTLETQGAIRVDLSMVVGAVSESVEVTTRSSPLLLTEQMEIGQQVDRDYIAKLPIPAGNYSWLVALSPNISTLPQSNTTAHVAVGIYETVGAVDIVPGGGGDNGFYMNGVNISDNYNQRYMYQPSMEAISESKVDVAAFSAVNGRDIVVVSTQMRSGADQFHGSAFEFFQNGKLNGWNPYTKSLAAPGQPKPFLTRNQFGGNLGGPILIPKVFNGRGKAFFFVNFEQFMQSQGQSISYARVPTEAERQGDFSGLLRKFPGDLNYVLYDPFSTTLDANGNSRRTPVPNNDLRGSRLSPAAQAMLADYPLPNGYQNPTNPNDLTNYVYGTHLGNNNYRLDTRFDYRFSDSDSVYVTFSQSHGLDNNSGGVFPELVPGVEDASRLLSVNYARVFTPHMTNEFIFGSLRPYRLGVLPAAQAYMHKTDTLFNKYLQNLGNPESLGFHQLAISGYPAWGFSGVDTYRMPLWQFSDNLSWLKGDHSLKFGFLFLQHQFKVINWRRTATFDKNFTSAGSTGTYRGGDAMASFLFGLPVSMNQQFVFENDEIPYRQWALTPLWGFYAEDKWQVNRRLTVSAGLRYDIPRSSYTTNNFGLATIDASYPGWQLAIPGKAAGVPLHNIPTPMRNFAPRLGIAYRPATGFVVRANYGIFFDTGTSEYFANRTSLSNNNVAGDQGEVFNNARFGVNNDVPYLDFSNLFPAEPPIKLGTYPVSTGIGTGYFTGITQIWARDQESGKKTSYYQRWALDIQKSVGPNTSLTVSYLGGRGTDLPYFENLNLPAYRTGWTSTAAYNNARPNNNGRFSDVYMFRHGYNSFYHSGTVKVQRHLTKGFQFIANYTLSKTVTDPAWWNTIGTVLDWYWHRNLGRGEAAFSHRHRFVSALTYEVPGGKTLPAAPRAVLSGWQVAAITTFESGDALTVTNGVTSARDQEPDVPFLSGNPNLSGGDRSTYRFFDTSVFSAPRQDVKGNSGVGIVRGPGLNNWNINLSKTFKLVERTKVEFRADMYNAFNHPQWSGLNTTYSDVRGNTFGRVTGARDGRVVSLSLRIGF